MKRAEIRGIAMRCACAFANSNVLRSWLLAAAMASFGAAVCAEQPIPAADPATPSEDARTTLCCGVPPADEVTADQVVGRWVVSRAPIGLPARIGESVAFKRDGTLQTARGVCRFAVLRAELTVACAGKEETGEVRFEDDKLIWRHDGRETIFIAPAD